MTQVNAGGRPPKLTPRLIDDVTRAVRGMAPLYFACRYAGISHQTVYNWRKTATEAEKRKPSERSQHQRLCLRFFDEIEKAEASTLIGGVATVMSAATAPKDAEGRRPFVRRTTTDKDGKTTVEEKELAADWRAMAWLLERRFRKEFSLVAEEPTEQPDGQAHRSVEEVIAEVERQRAEEGKPPLLRSLPTGEAAESV